MIGASLSVMLAVVDPVVIVDPPVGEESAEPIVSVASCTASSIVATVNVLLVSAGAKVSVPLVAVKSDPAVAVPALLVA